MKNEEEQMAHNGLNGLTQTTTAVEWLVEELEGDDSKIARIIGLKKYNSIIQQAKEMEKQQIEDAITQYEIKYNNVFSEQGILNVVNKAKQYYNETFKNK